MLRRRKKGSISELRRRLNRYELERSGKLEEDEHDWYGEKWDRERETAGRNNPVRRLFSFSLKEEALKTAVSLAIAVLVLTFHQLDFAPFNRLVHQVALVLNWDAQEAISPETIPAMREYLGAGDPNGGTTEESSLLLPLEGALVSGLRVRQNPVNETVEMHYGIDLEGAPGEEVKAAWSGEVERIEEESGRYRVAVIHDREWSTVYGGLQEPEVNAGDKLERGEVLGYLGEAVVREKAHLHFELRWRERPVNPFKHLPDWKAGLRSEERE